MCFNIQPAMNPLAGRGHTYYNDKYSDNGDPDTDAKELASRVQAAMDYDLYMVMTFHDVHEMPEDAKFYGDERYAMRPKLLENFARDIKNIDITVLTFKEAYDYMQKIKIY